MPLPPPKNSKTGGGGGGNADAGPGALRPSKANACGVHVHRTAVLSLCCIVFVALAAPSVLCEIKLKLSLQKPHPSA
jgi:hypothetical protein